MGTLFHFIENDPQFESYNIYNNFLVYKDRVPEKVIPFSEDPGGFQIAFDFRNTPGDPPVVLVNSDANKPENYLIKIGDNFEAFLQNLLSDEDLEEHGFH